MRSSLRRLVAPAVAAATVAGVVAGFNAHASTTFQLARVAGGDRYATAAAVAGNAFAGGATSAVIARGDGFPDALAGAYVAGVAGGPLLLTQGDTLTKATADQLKALGVKSVFLLGGTGAISQGVQDELAKSYTVTRVGGNNRYDTAARIAQLSNPSGVGTIGSSKTAIVASGEGFADALAAGPAAFAGKFPIILTTAAGLPDESKGALTALGIKHAVIVGGTSAVSANVVTQLTQAGIDSERIAGNNRYETATQLADFEATKLTGWSTSQIDLASGENFPDALGGGPAAGKGTRPLLLTAGSSLSPDTGRWLQLHAASLQGGRAYGGTGAIADSTVAAAVQAAGGTSQTLTGQVVRVDATNRRYTFVAQSATAPTTVNYKASDTFSVDGKSVTMAAFEAAITAADTIAYTGGTAATVASHVLTNVDPTTITSGTIGAVNEGSQSHTFKFVNAVTNDPLTAAIDYSKGSGWSIDGAANKTVADVDADVSAGDTITITGTVYALVNKSVTGVANTITHGNQLQSSTTFKIGALGDDPTAGDTPPLVTTNDSVYKAATADAFVGDAVDWTRFDQQISDGDQVTYSRQGGKQTFTLVNKAPATYAGQAAGAVSTNPVTGNTFTIALPDRALTVTQPTCSSSCWTVDGATVTQAQFEAAYSAGDLISFRAADATTNTPASVALTNQSLAGQIAPTTINTGSTPSQSGAAPRSYSVLATNGFTVLAQVTYADSQNPNNNAYVVDGTKTDQAGFEAALGKIASGTKGGTVVVEVAGSVSTHRLTTTS